MLFWIMLVFFTCQLAYGATEIIGTVTAKRADSVIVAVSLPPMRCYRQKSKKP
jgi:hypothetical protein